MFKLNKKLYKDYVPQIRDTESLSFWNITTPEIDKYIQKDCTVFPSGQVGAPFTLGTRTSGLAHVSTIDPALKPSHTVYTMEVANARSVILSKLLGLPKAYMRIRIRGSNDARYYVILHDDTIHPVTKTHHFSRLWYKRQLTSLTPNVVLMHTYPSEVASTFIDSVKPYSSTILVYDEMPASPPLTPHVYYVRGMSDPSNIQGVTQRLEYVAFYPARSYFLARCFQAPIGHIEVKVEGVDELVGLAVKAYGRDGIYLSR